MRQLKLSLQQMQNMMAFFKKLELSEKVRDLSVYLQKFSTHLKRALEEQVIINEVLNEDFSLSC